MFADPSGHMALWLLCGIVFGVIGAIIGAIYAGVNSSQAGNTGWDLVGDIAIGALIGAAIGFLIGALIGLTVSYLTTGTATASINDIRFHLALKEAQTGSYGRLAKFGTHNNKSRVVGLGKYIEGSPNSYEVLSQKYGYTYYSVEDKYWTIMEKALGDKTWEVNRVFLDQQLSLGKTFVKLSTDYTGSYWSELKYLGLI